LISQNRIRLNKDYYGKMAMLNPVFQWVSEEKETKKGGPIDILKISW
jgi:hypothetical protein